MCGTKLMIYYVVQKQDPNLGEGSIHVHPILKKVNLQVILILLD